VCFTLSALSTPQGGRYEKSKALHGTYLGTNSDMRDVSTLRLIVVIYNENNVAFAAFVFGEGADRYVIAGVGG